MLAILQEAGSVLLALFIYDAINALILHKHRKAAQG